MALRCYLGRPPADGWTRVNGGSNFCNHVENEIEPEYWKSDHIIEEIPKIIINLDSDIDTDSDGDHDSEGETTDMYWSE